jgi:uncharacterized protein YdaT
LKRIFKNSINFNDIFDSNSFKNMNWTFENFKPHLENLTPQAREKALEIAEHLMEKGGISEGKAIKEAIVRAEEWFLNSEG